jgi:hypothetical protein
MSNKIDRHGQAAILSPAQIELLFAEGLQADRNKPCSEFVSKEQLVLPNIPVTNRCRLTLYRLLYLKSTVKYLKSTVKK